MFEKQALSDYGAVQTHKTKLVTARDASMSKFFSIRLLRPNQKVQWLMGNGDLFF